MNKILKVIMEFDDKIQYLEGKEAQEWLSAADSMAIMESVRGRPFPEFKWVIESKKSDKKGE